MYASYYLTRVNLSLAQPLIRDDLGFTDQQMGWIVTGFLLCYGIGQLVSGILGDRFGARKTATLGMTLSSVCNVAFGLCFSLPMLIAFWALNGLGQSTGAPMRIKTLANWFPRSQRGKMMGLLGTDYQFGNVICWLLVGVWILPNYGWRAAFFVPAAVFFVSAIHFYFRVRNQPEDVGLPCIETFESLDPCICQPDPKTETLRFVLRQSIGNWRVWLVGFAYFGVDMIRYGFLVWAPTYLFDRGAPISETAYKMLMMPLAAIFGIVLSGFVSDKIGGRRAPVVAVMLFVVAVLTYFFPQIPKDSGWLSMACLAGIGFFLYGPHLMMGATMAIDLGSRKASGAASGLIDALGYAGAAVTTVGTAYVKDAYGWEAAFHMWILGAVLAGVLMLFLWNFRPGKSSSSQ
jgi:MFS transporter, OPA family, glycerol-3-phosphate transporter